MLLICKQRYSEGYQNMNKLATVLMCLLVAKVFVMPLSAVKNELHYNEEDEVPHIFQSNQTKSWEYHTYAQMTALLQ